MTINMLESSKQPVEPKRAAAGAAFVLVTLLVAKSLGSVPFVGAVALSGAVFVQLWLPLSRCDAWGLPWSVLGLDMQHWRAELLEVTAWAIVILPIYGLATAMLYVHGADCLVYLLGPTWQGALPVAHWGGLPQAASTAQWLALTGAAVQATATHVLGVALPEETFFRGYLQTQWQYVWPLPRHPAGPTAGLGRAAVAACAFFAVGHFLGEWHPGRLLPFFPGLLFAWQHNRRGSLIGCIALHALCNLFSAGWAACFVPGSLSAP